MGRTCFWRRQLRETRWWELRAGRDGLGQIEQGYLEQSNVSVVDEFINMIVAQRSYEAARGWCRRQTRCGSTSTTWAGEDVRGGERRSQLKPHANPSPPGENRGMAKRYTTTLESNCTITEGEGRCEKFESGDCHCGGGHFFRFLLRRSGAPRGWRAAQLPLSG